MNLVFEQHKNGEYASKQAAYLRNLFPFFGIPKPLRASLQKEHLPSFSTSNQLHAYMLDLWQKPEREFQYAACDLAIKHKKLWTPDSLKIFETLIREKSWWDTVDLLASNCVGSLIKRHPSLTPVMDQWIDDPHMWIRRSALLFQLRWKNETDKDILFSYCLKLADENDFFIRKAIGWALREYSKSNPRAVKEFIETHQGALSPLSVREGSKYLT